jgi:hypothetical protein
MNVIGEVLRLVSKLPPEGLALVEKLVRALVSSPDPMRAVKRAAMAAASEAASEKIIREALRRKKNK